MSFQRHSYEERDSNIAFRCVLPAIHALEYQDWRPLWLTQDRNTYSADEGLEVPFKKCVTLAGWHGLANSLSYNMREGVGGRIFLACLWKSNEMLDGQHVAGPRRILARGDCDLSACLLKYVLHVRAGDQICTPA